MGGERLDWLERWLRRSEQARPGAVVLGGSVNGLSFARSLGRRGVPVLMLDSQRYLGTFTRYATFGRLPPADEAPEAWLDLLRQIGQRRAAPTALFATSDLHAALVAKHQETLKDCFRFVAPSPETLNLVLDKRRQYEFAAAAGLPVPQFWIPTSIESARRLAAEVPYPCLLKPCTAHIGRKGLGHDKVVVVRTPEELVSAYARWASPEAHFLIQEIVPGPETGIAWYLTFRDAEGRERGWLSGTKLRQYPPDFGNGSLSVTAEIPEVTRLSRELLAGLDFRGYAGVEFKLNPRDQKYYLIELNPRSDSFNELAVGAGIDFPWLGYRYLMSSETEAFDPSAFRQGVKGLDEEQDVLAFLTLRRTGEINFAAWLRSIRGARLSTAAWDDPLPLLAGISRMGRAFRPDFAKN